MGEWAEVAVGVLYFTERACVMWGGVGVRETLFPCSNLF